MTIASIPDDQLPKGASKANIPSPAAQVVNPSSQKIENLYRNIEDEPLIKRIKALEERLMTLTGKYSVDEDIEKVAEQLGDRRIEADTEGAGMGRATILKLLLGDFNELLKIPYGALGYLVSSDSESIVKLYGVDTDMEFYAMVEGSKIRISSRRLERAVFGNKRFIGEAGLTLHNPAETTNNERLADEAISEIIASIKRKLSSAQ